MRHALVTCQRAPDDRTRARDHIVCPVRQPDIPKDLTQKKG